MNRKKLEQLVERWRSDAVHVETDDEAEMLELCADELAALLAEEAPVSAAETDKSLPLMARRPWMDAGEQIAFVGHDGAVFCAEFPQHYRAKFRIADTDEHGLPVIPRTADMPAWAKYLGQHVYCPAWHPLMATGGGWQRIEDFQGEQP